MDNNLGAEKLLISICSYNIRLQYIIIKENTHLIKYNVKTTINNGECVFLNKRLSRLKSEREIGLIYPICKYIYKKREKS
jgi:hypothetical protein